MDRIKAKQISDCLDTDSNQSVSGVKQFSAPQIFLGQAQSIVISEAYIYWTSDPNNLDQLGNSRISVINGMLMIETYTDQWNPM